MASLPCCKDNKPPTCPEKPCNCDGGDNTCPEFKGGCYLEVWQTQALSNWYASIVTKDGTYLSLDDLEATELSENFVTCGSINLILWNSCPPPPEENVEDEDEYPDYYVCDHYGSYAVKGDIGTEFISWAGGSTYDLNAAYSWSINLASICSLYATPAPDTEPVPDLTPDPEPDPDLID